MLAAIAETTAHNRYPEYDAWTLRQALGTYVGASPEQIIAGAGLDNVLETLMYLLLDPGDSAIVSEPTFMVYEWQIRGHGGEVSTCRSDQIFRSTRMAFSTP